MSDPGLHQWPATTRLLQDIKPTLTTTWKPRKCQMSKKSRKAHRTSLMH